MQIQRNRPRAFFLGSQGNIAISMAFTIAMLLSAAGGAIDFGRYTSARTELYAAMDAAVLAGTKVYWETGKKVGPALTTAQDYFNKDMKTHTDFTKLNINFKINSQGNGVASYGEAAISTPMLSLVGLSELTLLSKGVDEADVAMGSPPGGAENVEIAMMLDVTGSMCSDGAGPCTSGTKISALKTAANNLVDKVLPSGGSTKTTRLSIVPFSTRVRLGADGQGAAIMKSVTNLPATWSGWDNICTSGSGSGGSETGGNWTCQQSTVTNASNWKIMPCVTDRYFNATGDSEFTDAKPGANNWLNAHAGDRMPLWIDSSDNAPTSGTGLTAADAAGQWNYTTDGSCADIDNSDVVVPLTNSSSTLKTAISGLSAYGSTSGALGTAMSWYTISPNWSSVWPSASAAGPYADLTTTGTSGATKLRKVAVLMTDGGYNTVRSYKDSDIATVSGYATKLCTNMKAAGIEIYTVGFDLAGLSAKEAGYATDTLTQCATDAQHFINANSASDLIAAFDNIGAQLTAGNIRLTK